VTQPALRVFDDHEAASRAVAELFAERLGHGGRAALAGGNTPRRAFELLGERAIDWSKIELIASDERCLPVGHAERNDQMIRAMMGERGFTLHGFSAELGAEAAAAATEPVVKRLVPFDLVLLGLGEDGHTASLFPGQADVARAATLVAPVHHSPKPPPDRVTLTLKALGSARTLVFLATGAAKRWAIEQLVSGGEVPAAWVTGADVRIWTDRAARG
jgi:6-phosphogluconolactonase